MAASTRQDLLEDAIKASKDSSKPISAAGGHRRLLQDANIDYHGGERFPHLTRDEAKPDYLDELIRARAAAK